MAEAAAQDQPGSLQNEAVERREAARNWKSLRILDFKECYFFLAPSRQRQLSSQTAPSTQTMLDEGELNTDQGFIVAQDFCTEIVNTYLPEAQVWCESKAAEGFEDAFEQIKDEAKKIDAKIFSAIKASNFYAELPKAILPDLCIGTAGLYIDRARPGQPVQVLAVPMREIEINLGPDGEIDDRFIIRFARNSYLRKLLGEDVWAKVDDETKQKLKDKPSARTEICWGWWRDWDDLRDESWQHVVLLGSKLIHDVKISGEGCCPFIVMRFNPVADWPWAIGPIIQGLPTFRQLDESELQKGEAIERTYNPAIKYPDDGVTNVEQGIEPGMGYPTRPGSGQDFGPIYQQPSVDAAIFDQEDKIHRLRKLFFVDHPEQTGDTPPTLGQWLDELARVQRRIGTAGTSFWREGPMRIFLRFKYLLQKAGTIPGLQDKQNRIISTQAYNPTQRAAEQQEIATAVQCLQICLQTFPEEGRLVIDGAKTINNFIAKMRTAGMIGVREKDAIQKVLPMITQLIGGRQRAGAAEPAEGAGAPAAA